MSDTPARLLPIPDGYTEWIADLKGRIHAAQQRATLAVNRELVLVYWQIGRDILDRQGRQGWGAKVIDRLAADLRTAFPDIKGFSPRNLKYMRAFAEAWPDAEFVQQAAAQLPWFHLCTIIDKLKTRDERDWYLAKAAEHNWSRNVLVMQIETHQLERSGKAVTNFDATLPKPESDLARESLKDPSVRLSEPHRRGTRAGDRKRPGQSCHRIPVGAWRWLCLRGSANAFGRGR